MLHRQELPFYLAPSNLRVFVYSTLKGLSGIRLSNGFRRRACGFRKNANKEPKHKRLRSQGKCGRDCPSLVGGRPAKSVVERPRGFKSHIPRHFPLKYLITSGLCALTDIFWQSSSRSLLQFSATLCNRISFSCTLL